MTTYRADPETGCGLLVIDALALVAAVVAITLVVRRRHGS